MQAHLRALFERWGCPERLRVDNGRPLANPQRDLPSPLALWLLGHGIEVVPNRPRHPQDNAIVENLQGSSARWVEPHRCPSHRVLGERLRQAARLQRAVYPTRVLQGRTRLASYPELEQNRRRFAAEGFDYARVAAHLSQGSYVRKVASNGQITLYGHRYQVGYRYRRQTVRVVFEAAGSTRVPQWHVYDQTGELAVVHPAPNLSAERVVALTIGRLKRSGQSRS